jgi:hypothetical protein
MFKPHYGTCKNPSCQKDDVLIVVKDGWCEKCNYNRKQEKKKAAGKKHGKYTYKKEATGEKSVFEYVLERDEPRCFVCGDRLTLIMAHNFAHVLAKGKYPAFRLYPDNIRLMCFKFGEGCHEKYDQQPHSNLKGDGWDRLFELRDRLKAEYENREITNL